MIIALFRLFKLMNTSREYKYKYQYKESQVLILVLLF